MTQAPISVVVVSHGRADLLRRCLMGLSQLFYTNYEVIVVADQHGLAALRNVQDQIKTVAFETPNISIARNLGIAQAAGDIVAFIDDDAVPEPTWLDELTKGFALDGVGAVGGYVRGRNGLNFQWKAGLVDATGTRYPIEGPDAAFCPSPAPGRVAKLEGTNMAIRRELLVQLDGFDPAFRYYLDETDLCWRIAQSDQEIAFAPAAEVHHGFAENSTRGGNRAPKSLFEIGASKAVFLKKHAGSADLDSHLDAFRNQQRKRLLGFLHYGMIEPRDISRLLKTLDAGFLDGRDRPAGQHEIVPSQVAFLPFQSGVKDASVMLSGRTWQRRGLLRQASGQHALGKTVSVFLFGPSFRRHHVRFDPPGIWIQSGGLWGKSDRAAGLWFGSFKRRVTLEWRRSARQRTRSDAHFQQFP